MIEEPNYFDYSGFYDEIAEQPFLTFVEVGCWLGHSISYLAKKIKHKPNVKIHAVDLFDDSYALKRHKHLDGIRYDIFMKNLKEAQVEDMVIPIKGLSLSLIHI